MRNKITTPVIIFFYFCVIGLMIINIIGQKDGFWGTSFLDIVEVLILLYVSYYLVQKENASNRKKEKLDLVLVEIHKKILDSELISVGNKTEKLITRIKLRSISNLIKFVKDNVNEKMQSKLEYVEEQNNNLMALCIDHIDDVEYIEKSQADFQRIITNISDKLVEIHLDLENT